MNIRSTVILAAIDDTPASSEVMRTALGAARGFDAGALHLVYVAEPPLTDFHQIVRLADLLEEGKAILAHATAAAAERFAGRIESHLAVDLAAGGILQAASDVQADLIVVGSHGRRCLQRLVLGSVARAVIDRAHCSVVVARTANYPIAAVPVIEPACPRCLEVQRTTAGAKLWCADHERRSLSPHLHYRVAEPYSGL